MGLTETEAHCSVRFSLGIHNSLKEIEEVIKLFTEVIEESKNTVRFLPCR
jgi:cysteine sulfinate desulfinase/cysteine desulfurase-like protein